MKIFIQQLTDQLDQGLIDSASAISAVLPLVAQLMDEALDAPIRKDRRQKTDPYTGRFLDLVREMIEAPELPLGELDVPF
jgi:hypothetical protein